MKHPWYGIRPTFLLFRGDVLYVAVSEPHVDPKTQSDSNNKNIVNDKADCQLYLLDGVGILSDYVYE